MIRVSKGFPGSTAWQMAQKSVRQVAAATYSPPPQRDKGRTQKYALPFHYNNIGFLFLRDNYGRYQIGYQPCPPSCNA